jgi:nitroreductase
MTETPMTFDETIRRQRMVRPPYQDRAVSRDLVTEILRNSQKAPSAGFSQGFAFVVLEGDDTETFWEYTMSSTPADQRPKAPVIILPLENAQAYVDRYSEPDKQFTGLGESADKWPVPFWTVDTSFASMIILLSATAHGLGGWFFGIFDGERALLDHLGVPSDFRAIGAIALGYRTDDELRSSSLKRGRKPAEEVFHWGRW